MNSNSKDNLKNKQNIDYNSISLFSGVLSSIYQYNLMLKSDKPLSKLYKFGMCSGAFVICFTMTRLILKNINNI